MCMLPPHRSVVRLCAGCRCPLGSGFTGCIMGDSPQAKARIQIDTDLGQDVLLATGIIGQESISRPYVYNLTLISKDFDIHPEQMLTTKVGIRVRKEKEGEYRGLSGFVLGFAG